MKQNKHKLSSKWLIPLLLVIIGGSIVLVANAFLRHPYETGNRTSDSVLSSASGSIPDIVSANTTPTVNSNTFSVQSHPNTPTVARSPSVTPANNPTLTPTAPGGNNSATLPPGSALPGDSTCASRVIMSSFE